MIDLNSEVKVAKIVSKLPQEKTSQLSFGQEESDKLTNDMHYIKPGSCI